MYKFQKILLWKKLGDGESGVAKTSLHSPPHLEREGMAAKIDISKILI